MTRGTTGTRVDEVMTVVDTRSACWGCMSSETLYVVFRRPDGERVDWWSDSSHHAVHLATTSAPLGGVRRVRVTGFLRNGRAPRHLYRVKVRGVAEQTGT